jgi:type VII secretion integral membrane protein EccD
MTRSTAAPPGAPPVDGTGRAGDAFCRIRLAAPGTQVDLAVPSAPPLARLLPTLLQHAGQGGADAGGWALSRADGARLDPSASLAAAGVREGGLLVLHRASEWNPPPVYDDVVELVGQGGVRRPWTTREVRWTCAVLVTVAVLGALGALAFARGVLPGVLAGATAGLLVATGWALSRGAGDIPAGTLAVVLAAPCGALAAAEFLGGGWGRGHLLLASLAVVLVAAVGPAAVGAGDGPFAALGVLGLAGALGAVVAILGDARPAQAAAVVAPLALAATTLLPTLALRAARLPRTPLPRSAEDLAAVRGQLDLARTTEQVAQARRLLSGLVAGSQASAAAGVLVLAADGMGWSRALAGVLAVVGLMRGRLFREREQVAAAAVAAAGVLLVGTAIVVGEFARQPSALVGVVAPILTGVALMAAVIGGIAGRRPATPRLTRGLDLLETLLMLSVVPLGLAVWDVYRILLDLRA